MCRSAYRVGNFSGLVVADLHVEHYFTLICAVHPLIPSLCQDGVMCLLHLEDPCVDGYKWYKPSKGWHQKKKEWTFGWCPPQSGDPPPLPPPVVVKVPLFLWENFFMIGIP